MDFEVLKKVSQGLNKLKCTWAIGGSVLLKIYGLVENPNDIDILIDAKDTKKIKEFMNTIGKIIELPSKDPFKTKEFFGYDVNGTIIEFMGDFKIKLDNESMYKFVLDKESIINFESIESISIPTTTLEDWVVAYIVMKDPKNRVSLIKEYFNKEGIKHRYLLERNLKQNLTKIIENQILEILNISK